MKGFGCHQLWGEQFKPTGGGGGAIDRTSDFLSDLSVGREDRSLPRDIEVGLDSHSCLRSTEMLD